MAFSLRSMSILWIIKVLESVSFFWKSPACCMLRERSSAPASSSVFLAVSYVLVSSVLSFVCCSSSIVSWRKVWMLCEMIECWLSSIVFLTVNCSLCFARAELTAKSLSCFRNSSSLVLSSLSSFSAACVAFLWFKMCESYSSMVCSCFEMMECLCPSLTV